MSLEYSIFKKSRLGAYRTSLEFLLTKSVTSAYLIPHRFRKRRMIDGQPN